MVKTEILKVKGDWNEVLNDCRFSANKEPIDKEPSDQFKKDILIAEHSPIRNISFKFRWQQIKHWVAVHWVRHIWYCVVNTQRSDRTGLDRDKLPQDTLQNFIGEENVQHLIDTDRKRLCFQASPETRECAVSQKLAIEELEPLIASVLVPNCIYRCGCCEKDGCKHFDNFLVWWNANSTEPIEITNVQERYDVYNRYFHEVMLGKQEGNSEFVESILRRFNKRV